VEIYATDRGWQLEQVFQDIASGLNNRRPGLRRLLEASRMGHLDRILITYDDRLARFGTNLLEWLLNLWSVKLERIQPVQLTSDPEQQLLKDLIALMTSVAGKFQRRRRGKQCSAGSTP
jgi:predicted site-specific integrase-resolvase